MRNLRADKRKEKAEKAVGLPDEYLKRVQFLKKKQDAWRPVFLYDTIRRAEDSLSADVLQAWRRRKDAA